MLSNLSAYLNRSTKYVLDNTTKSTSSSLSPPNHHDADQPSVLRMEGANELSRAPITLLRFQTHEDLDNNFATGCDVDIGGTSTVNFALDECPERNKGSGSSATARFWGEMRLDVRPELRGKIRGGYAGFRSKVSPLSSVSDDTNSTLAGAATAVAVRRDMRRPVESPVPGAALTAGR